MLKPYIKLLRLPQWIKNLFVFVPLIFSQNLFYKEYLFNAFLGFIAFCLVSSVVYIINDIFDVESDRYHPKKKHRPIASGKVTAKSGIILAAGLSLIIIFLLSYLNLQFIISVIIYLSLMILYSIVLKHIVLLDVFSIAAGFMIRVIAGALVINVEISSWLLLTTMFISLFLAVMKRHSELNLLSDETMVTRKVLTHYSLNFTSQMATVAAAGVIICYALYSVAERTRYIFGTENLIYTTPFVVFGIFRYMYLVYMNKRGESTTEIMIGDAAMLVNIFLYLLAVTLIIY